MQIQTYNIYDLINRRSDQPSYHMASEKHIRIEFHNFRLRGTLGPVRYKGDLIITTYKGHIGLEVDGVKVTLSNMDQAVVPEGHEVRLICEDEPTTVQIIWSPPFAESES